MKISQYDHILLDNITSSDLLYIVDSNETDSTLSSKNLTYGTLLSALNRDLEQVLIVDDVEYKPTEKKLYIYVKLTDGSRKTIAIPMEDLNIYSVADGLSNYNGNDNIFCVDWTKIYKKSELSNADEVKTAIDNILKKQYLSATALDEISGNWNSAFSSVYDTSSDWNTAYSRVLCATDGLSDNVGALAYKDSVSASEVIGYKDTTYLFDSNKNGILSIEDSDGNKSEISVYQHPEQSYTINGFYQFSTDKFGHVSSTVNVTSIDIVNLGIPSSDTTYSTGFGLSANNTEFAVDTDKIALKEHMHDYLSSNALASLSDNWEEAYNKTINAKSLISNDLSDIVDNNTLSAVDNKLQCIKAEKTYYAGNGLSLDIETNTFSTSAEYVTYVYVVQHLSNEGYYATFRDWGFKN